GEDRGDRASTSSASAPSSAIPVVGGYITLGGELGGREVGTEVLLPAERPLLAPAHEVRGSSGTRPWGAHGHPGQEIVVIGLEPQTTSVGAGVVDGGVARP